MMLILAAPKRHANNDRLTAIMAIVVSIRATPLKSLPIPNFHDGMVMVTMMILLLVVRIKRRRLSEGWIAAALPC